MTFDERDGTGDSFSRIKSGPDEYQCGCRWQRTKWAGDVLKLCPIHRQASAARLARAERERAR